MAGLSLQNRNYAGNENLQLSRHSESIGHCSLVVQAWGQPAGQPPGEPESHYCRVPLATPCRYFDPTSCSEEIFYSFDQVALILR